MFQIGMHEAKTRLSELVKLVRRGEQVCLTNHGEVVAEIVLPHKMRKRNASAIMRKLQKLVKEHPLGTFDEMMAWRREGAE
jgi:prevent-host-death family protein